MIVVAGPPGSGKSTAFPVQSEGVDFFNADNRAAELNGGSFQNIPPDIRNRVNREFEDFINQRIDSRSSFAFETTLRTSVTCVQARHAYAHGFHRLMTYVGLNSAEECIQRVMNRAHHGGHSAPAELIRQSYAASIQNLGEAFKWFSRVHVYDNSAFDQPPRLVAICAERTIYAASDNRPIWVSAAIAAYNRLR